MTDRHTMTPVEFDAACRELVQRCPYLSETSGTRSEERNAAVGGHPESKHRYGLARDFVGDNDDYSDAEDAALSLGLWFRTHDKGSGNHIHVQGAAIGALPTWWVEKFLDEDDND